LCHSERSEESRIFLDAKYCTLNHGSTAKNAGCPLDPLHSTATELDNEPMCVGESGILRFALE